MAQGLVDHPDSVAVEVLEPGRDAVFELSVHPDDLGHVIGKQGRTARSLRLALGAAADATPMSLVRVGSLGRTHGVHGEITLHDTSLTSVELHAVRSFVWRNREGKTRPLTIATARPGRAWQIVRFDGIAGKDEAAQLTLGELWTEPERLPDPGPGVAYTFQLFGLRVATEDGRTLGTLEQILGTPAHPVYVVRGERDKELLVPATVEVVKRVDLAGGLITVALPAGLEDL